MSRVFTRFTALTVLALLLLSPALLLEARAEPIQFQSADGLAITGEVTRPQGAPKTAIVLFHQAGSSRGEYHTIAPKLAEKGYLVLAIDQRSGNGFAGIANETAKRARKASMGTKYTDAIPDLEAAVAYARGPLGAEKVIVWGSSYSAALVLALAGQDQGFADGVLAFSPGEYFSGKPAVKTNAAKIAVPVFITAAKSEAGQWAAIFKAIPDTTVKTGFVPKGVGLHGSSALIPDRSTNEDEYWGAVEAFLAQNLPPGPN